MGKSSGKPLSAFDKKRDARKEGRRVRKTYHQWMYVYRCEKCDKFHLAPRSGKIRVKHNACSCTDSKGASKALYMNWRSARKQLKKSQQEQNIKLRIYRCPERHGWHLTHTEKRR